MEVQDCQCSSMAILRCFTCLQWFHCRGFRLEVPYDKYYTCYYDICSECNGRMDSAYAIEEYVFVGKVDRVNDED